jgi:D-alanyl-D-alanine carboxypeptidase (penicillin-binding protein 5/6)
VLILRRSAAGARLLVAGALTAATASLALGGLPAAAAAPASTVGGPDLASTGVVVHLRPGAKPLPKIDADTWVLADLTTGQVLAAKNAHKKVLPASTLKTLTSLSLMPRLDKNKVVTATAREAGQIGSKVGLVPGATYTIWDLWNALLLPSANDAAMALADAYGGAAPTVALMQSEAKRLGALDTTPKTPSGLDTPGQVTSAYDMALFARAALQIPDFRTVTMTTYYQFPGKMPAAGKKRSTYQLYTENRLLRHGYKGVAGGKTGFTSLAHRTFWGAAQRGGHLLVVTLFQIHEPTETAAEHLLNWGFANLGKVTPVGTLVAPAGTTANGTPSAGSTASAGAGSTKAGSVAAAGLSSTAAPTSSRRSLVWIGLLAVAAMAALLGWVLWRRRAGNDGSHALGVPLDETPATTAATAAVATPAPVARPAAAPLASSVVVVGGAGRAVADDTAAAPPAAAPAVPAEAPARTQAPVAPVAVDDDTAPVPVVGTGGHVRVVRPPSRPDA